MLRLLRTVFLVGSVAVVTACGGGSEVDASVEPACEVQSVARMDIQTAKGASISSKLDYLDAAIKITGVDGQVAEFGSRVKGRGNSTWEMPKKPYYIELEESIGLLGMPPGRNWNLLANYADKTLMRTALAFCIAKNLGMKWVPESHFVELTLNGDYQGLYQMTPHIEVGPFKVDLGVGEGVKFLAEIDERLDGSYPRTTNYGTSLIIRSNASSVEAERIYEFIDDMENAIYENKNPWSVVDRKSLAHSYIVNELARNNDSFWSSTYFYKPVGGLVVFGPVWDFDVSMGNINYNNNWLTDGFWVKNIGYISAAFRNSEFEEEVKNEWRKLDKKIPSLLAYLDSQAENFKLAQKRNFAKWDILNIYVWPNHKVTGSYDLEVEYLKEWLLARAEWLGGQFEGVAD